MRARSSYHVSLVQHRVLPQSVTTLLQGPAAELDCRDLRTSLPQRLGSLWSRQPAGLLHAKWQDDGERVSQHATMHWEEGLPVVSGRSWLDGHDMSAEASVSTCRSRGRQLHNTQLCGIWFTMNPADHRGVHRPMMFWSPCPALPDPPHPGRDSPFPTARVASCGVASAKRGIPL